MPAASRPVVLVCQPFLFNQRGAWREILETAGMEIRFPVSGGKVLTEAQLVAEMEGVAATIASTEPYTASILERAASLRVISRTGVGYDSIDVAAATRRGVAAAITPGTNHEAVAEHTFALLLAAMKRIVPGHAVVAEGSFSRQPVGSLRGKTLGIVGLGRIGQAVALRAAAFGMHVVACDPYLRSAPPEASNVELVGFDELLAQSDIISLHAAATPDTARLIRRETLGRMKRGVVLINTARGTLIDEAALAESLEAGHVRAAGLDVFEREPPVGCPLLALPNVVLSPHVAGIDERALEDMATMAAQTIVDLHQRRWPQECIVNAGQLAQPWKWD